MQDDQAVTGQRAEHDFTTAFADLERDGFCVVPDVLSPGEVATVKARLQQVARAEAADGINGRRLEGPHNQRVYALTHKGDEFVSLLEHPVLWAFMTHLLGPDFLLSSITANIAGPGGPAMALHPDQGYVPPPWPPYPLVANMMWMLDDFTAENGATRIVPGSHQNATGGPTDQARTAEAIPATGRAGSVLCFDGRVLHQTGANTTADQLRHGVLTYCCPAVDPPAGELVHVTPGGDVPAAVRAGAPARRAEDVCRARLDRRPAAARVPLRHGQVSRERPCPSRPVMAGALQGIRVLELGHAVSAPHCAQVLADHGADVIRIEPPGGDRTRWALPVVDQDSLYFAAHNRGKRSVIINLKDQRGRELFLDLAGTADVVVTNYSARVPDQLGIGYTALRERNPRIIFVHITGFGASGAGRDFGAYDGIIQAMSGVPSLSGEPGGPPALSGAFVADHLAALQAVTGTLLALARRTTTGTGGFVEISMLEGYFSTLAHHVASAVDLGIIPGANANQVQTAFANTFPAADGYVYLAPLAPKAWQALCRVIDAPDWVAASEPRWRIGAGRDEVERVVSKWTSARPRAEIVSELRAVGVPCGPVNDVADAVADPVHAGRDPVAAVRMPSGRILHVPGPEVRLGLVAGQHVVPPDGDGVAVVPAAGAHTAQVVAELGRAPADIVALARLGVIGPAGLEPDPVPPPDAALTTSRTEGA